MTFNNLPSSDQMVWAVHTVSEAPGMPYLIAHSWFRDTRIENVPVTPQEGHLSQLQCTSRGSGREARLQSQHTPRNAHDRHGACARGRTQSSAWIGLQ
jgi:hypothetical protein